MKVWVEKARRPEMLGGIGGFAGLFDATALKAFDHPLLATSADGVGTKVAIAQALDVHHTIGFDLVGHARRRPGGVRRRAAVPHRLHRDRPRRTRAHRGDRAGHRRGLRAGRLCAGRRRDGRAPRTARARTSTTSRARPPASSRPPTCSVPGACEAGDVVVAMGSSGLHSNGYSLVRHVLLSEAGAGWSLDRHVDELGRTLGEELLEPTTVYAKACLDLARSTPTHAMSHVTGGGLAANLERVMPDSLVATIDRGSWTPPAGLRPGPPGRRRRPGRPGAHPQLRGRHGGPAPGGRAPSGPSPC